MGRHVRSTSMAIELALTLARLCLAPTMKFAASIKDDPFVSARMALSKMD